MRFGILLAALYALGSGYLVLEVASRSATFPLLGIAILLAAYFAVQAAEMAFKSLDLDVIGGFFFSVEVVLLVLALICLSLFEDSNELRLSVKPWGFSALLFIILILPSVNRYIRMRLFPEKMRGGANYYRLLTFMGVSAAILSLFWQYMLAQIILLLMQCFYAFFTFCNKTAARLFGGRNLARARSLLRDPPEDELAGATLTERHREA